MWSKAGESPRSGLALVNDAVTKLMAMEDAVSFKLPDKWYNRDGYADGAGLAGHHKDES
ncbi:MAG: hypothetical protein QUS33_01115 [Dehalococcoidia bacterium]|nr:hypothetical protein [Dehalococcoidia bacterium]